MWRRLTESCPAERLLDSSRIGHDLKRMRVVVFSLVSAEGSAPSFEVTSMMP